MSLTTAQRLAASAAVAEVRRAFAAARDRVYSAASGVFATDAAKAIRKQFYDQSARAETWATSELAQVEKGHLDFDRWREFGEVYARYAAGTVKDSYNATLFRVVKDTVKETADTVTSPTKWSGGVQAALGVAAALVVAVVVLKVLR